MFRDGSQERGFSGVGTLLMESSVSLWWPTDGEVGVPRAPPGLRSGERVAGPSTDRALAGMLPGTAFVATTVCASHPCFKASWTVARSAARGISSRRRKSQQHLLR